MKDNVLIKRNGVWCMTHLQAHKRYVNTIKPLEDFLKWLDDGLKDVEEILDHDTNKTNFNI